MPLHDRTTPPAWLDELPLRPGPPWVAMGVRALDEAGWLVVDDRFDEELALKEQLAARDHEAVFLAEPGTEPAGAEVLAMVEAWLAAHAPDRARPADPSLHPLDAASRLVQEDLCLLAGDGHRLVAAAVAFPSHWRIGEKVGHPIAAVHAPVHHYEEDLRAKVDTFIARLAPGRLTVRRNLSFHDHDDLFRPEPSEDYDRLHPALGDLWLRTERQTLVRLRDHDAVLFTIRTQLAPVSVLEHRPDVATALAARIRALHAELDRLGHPPWSPRWLPDVLDGYGPRARADEGERGDEGD